MGCHRALKRKRGVCHVDACIAFYTPPVAYQWGTERAGLPYLASRMVPVAWEFHGGPWGRWTALLKWDAAARNCCLTLAPRGITRPQECRWSKSRAKPLDLQPERALHHFVSPRWACRPIQGPGKMGVSQRNSARATEVQHGLWGWERSNNTQPEL
jgi:hypothetical protein